MCIRVTISTTTYYSLSYKATITITVGAVVTTITHTPITVTVGAAGGLHHAEAGHALDPVHYRHLQ